MARQQRSNQQPPSSSTATATLLSKNQNRHYHTSKMFMNVFLLLIVFCSNVANASYSMVVPSGKQECFVIRPPENTMSLITGNYDMLEDELSPDPLTVVIYGSNNREMYHSSVFESEGTFTIAGIGTHQFCISNGLNGKKKADGKDRTVGFAIRVKPVQRGKDSKDDKEGPDNEHTANLMSLSSTLIEGLETMKDHQQYVKDREARYLLLAAHSYQRVMRWTFVEALVLMFIAGGQIMYLRKFFEQKRYL
mmetsp:Transcript_29538/g.43959  ORF Transcript_29538/g.43959 Transcript_29538/m.43959 type:complete len:250 (-) Transcript_29538:364-1113(-)